MANTLVLLAKHPDVSDKLRKDLLAMDAKGESLRKSEYLRCVIEECTRMLPMVAQGVIKKTGETLVNKKIGTRIPWYLSSSVHREESPHKSIAP